MANDRRKPERKTDKVQRYTDRLSKIAYAVGLAFIIYIIWPLREDIKDLREEISSTTKECMSEINKVRHEANDKYDKLKDQLFAMLNKINK